MKKILLINCFLLLSCPLFAQKKAKAYKDGEWLKYKMSYSGFFKAGTAELSLKETELDGKKVFHANGFGKTSDFIGSQDKLICARCLEALWCNQSFKKNI